MKKLVSNVCLSFAFRKTAKNGEVRAELLHALLVLSKDSLFFEKRQNDLRY